MPSKIRGGTKDKHLADMHIPRVSALGAGGGAAGLGLKTNLIAWWELGEASGNRADSHTNGLTLTDINTVTSNPGIGGVGTAAQFTAVNAERLSRAYDVNYFGAGNFDAAAAFWIYLDSTDANGRYFWSIYRSFWIGYAGTGTNRIHLRGKDNSGNDITVNADALGAPSTGTWYFLVAQIDSTNKKWSISANGGTVNETTATAVGIGNGLSSGLLLGRDPDSEYFNGRGQYVGYWRRAAAGGYILSAAQITALYNAGAGLGYAALT